jgi:hypothetical protein
MIRILLTNHRDQNPIKLSHYPPLHVVRHRRIVTGRIHVICGQVHDSGYEDDSST